MSFGKQHLFKKEHQLLSSFANGLSHPARLSILEFLSDHPESNVEEITNAIPLSRTTVSYHLKRLRELELLNFYEKCPYIFYSISWERIEKFIVLSLSISQQLSDQIKLRNNGLGQKHN